MPNTNKGRGEHQRKLLRPEQVDVALGDPPTRHRMKRFIDCVSFVMRQQRQRIAEAEQKQKG